LIFTKYHLVILTPDKEPPVVDFCQSPPIFLVDSPDDLERGYVTDIEWSEPIFHDNSLEDVTVDVETTTDGFFADGRFAVGQTTLVTYRDRFYEAPIRPKIFSGKLLSYVL
jgi:hypothetical protein